MNKGDIVLVPFPFTDLSGSKFRPALVLIETDEDITICFVTTKLKWRSTFDVVISPTIKNGLKKTSLLRLSKFATIDKDLIIGLLGRVEVEQLMQINRN